MKSLKGLVAISTIICISIALWLLSKDSLSSLFDSPYRSVAQFTAILAITFLCLEFVLSARIPFVNALFGDPAKAYKVHHATGGLAFSFMLTHVIFLVLSTLPELSRAVIYILPSKTISYSAGVFALYSFITLLSLTFYIKLPYNTWKKTHTLLIIPLFIVSIHVATITSDVSRFLPLRLWLILLTSIAIASYTYHKWLRNYFSKQYSYIVSEIRTEEDIVLLTLKPTTRSLKFTQGQYVFLTVNAPGLTGEEHPFSMTSNPKSSTVEFGIKQVGDWTKKLGQIKKGTSVTLKGPYGEFGEKMPSSKYQSLWIAGGIGVTPFISMLSNLPNTPGNEILFLYLTKSKIDGVFDKRIQEIIQERNLTVSYIHHPSSDLGRYKWELLKEYLSKKRTVIHVCGPEGMMDEVIDFVKKQKVSNHDIISEEFTLS